MFRRALLVFALTFGATSARSEALPFTRKVRHWKIVQTKQSGASPFKIGRCNNVNAGAVGEHPRLKGLKEGNLVHGTDFRQVYAAVLDKWLGVDSKPIVGDGFKPVEVFGE